MENAPYETVDVWMRQTNLNPRNLMPALLKYDHSKAPENITQASHPIILLIPITSLNDERTGLKLF